MSFKKPDWEPRDGFGRYLRNLRQRRGLKLTEAAELLGVSFGHLGKLERGEITKRRPSLAFLALVARTYDVPAENVHTKAGYLDLGVLTEPEQRRASRMVSARREGLGDQRTAEAFRRIVLSAALRPEGMSLEVVDCIAPRFQKAWVEFAEKLEQHVRWGGPSVRVLKRRPLHEQEHASAQMPMKLTPAAGHEEDEE